MDLVEGDDAVEEAEGGGGASAFEEMSLSVATPFDRDPGLDPADREPAEAEEGEADEGDVDALPSLHRSALAVAAEEEEDEEEGADRDREARDDDRERLGPRRMQERVALAPLFHILVADQSQHHAREDEEDPLEDAGNRETISSVHRERSVTMRMDIQLDYCCSNYGDN